MLVSGRVLPSLRLCSLSVGFLMFFHESGLITNKTGTKKTAARPYYWTQRMWSFEVACLTHDFVWKNPENQRLEMAGTKGKGNHSRWWFQIFFIFTPTCKRFPFWQIFFKGVETTNQSSKPPFLGSMFNFPRFIFWFKPKVSEQCRIWRHHDRYQHCAEPPDLSVTLWVKDPFPKTTNETTIRQAYISILIYIYIYIYIFIVEHPSEPPEMFIHYVAGHESWDAKTL